MDSAPAIKTVKTAAYCGCSDTVDINQIKWNRKNNHLFKSSSCQMVAISNSSSYKAHAIQKTQILICQCFQASFLDLSTFPK